MSDDLCEFPEDEILEGMAALGDASLDEVLSIFNGDRRRAARAIYGMWIDGYVTLRRASASIDQPSHVKSILHTPMEWDQRDPATSVYVCLTRKGSDYYHNGP